MSVMLTASENSPAALGTLVRWQASVMDAQEGTLWYRFRQRHTGEDFHMIRDYGPNDFQDWTTIGREDWYEVEVSVRNLKTGQTVGTSVSFQFVSRVTDGTPVISRTRNPLVVIYSAPACTEGSRMMVRFVGPDGDMQSTPFSPCRAGLSMNFYLAGMRPNTTYTVTQTLATKTQLTDGPPLLVTAGDGPTDVPAYKILTPPASSGPTDMLLQSTLGRTTIATDLVGNVIWSYSSNITFLTRPEAGGLFWGIGEDPLSGPSAQFVRQFDLAGVTILETNAAQINEQLALMKVHEITGFHHEARTLRDGNILVLANSERLLADVQGPGDVDVLGDTILVLDENLRVVWAWDAFDHLDVARTAVLKETCTPSGGGCPPFHSAPVANDWLHGNAVQQTPDGNLLYSARHQDWLIKIDYNGGQGTGMVLWRLGTDGDFLMMGTDDPNPWFSHQHDSAIQTAEETILTVFDNGNTRREFDQVAHSRGQALELDEQGLTARLLLNSDLGVYSLAVGSARRLPNGNYHFNAGFLNGNTNSRSIEVDGLGNIVYALEASVPEYRSFRLRDLYSGH